MVYEYRGKAKLTRNPEKESLITIEANTEKEAEAKLRKYIAIGKKMRWYAYEGR